jgi:hypothetical protein
MRPGEVASCSAPRASGTTGTIELFHQLPRATTVCKSCGSDSRKSFYGGIEGPPGLRLHRFELRLQLARAECVERTASSLESDPPLGACIEGWPKVSGLFVNWSLSYYEHDESA